MNPATPATIFALAATVLLALATCTAPVTKSLYFLEVNISNRDLKLGALGYCLGSRCTSPSVGYRIDDANSLLGVNTNIPYAEQLSSGVVHALTYTLILHPIACGLAAIAVLFGLLNHCAGFGIGCVGGFFTGFAITVSLVAFGLDLGLFTVLKKRVESEGGTASYGNGIWMTLAAFVLLVLCQIAFCCCCCGSRGGRGGSRRRHKDHKDDFHTPHPDSSSYGDRMRMDALQAEVNRNNRPGQQDLPKFAEYVTEHEVPLKQDYSEGAYDDHRMHNNAGQAMVGQAYGGGPNEYADPYGQQHQQHHQTGYVPGVGPAYGDNSATRGDQYDYNNVGGFGAHGYGYPEQSQQGMGGEGGYPYNGQDPHQYYQNDGSAPPQAVGGVVGRQPSTYHYGDGAHRSRRPSEASRTYAPSMTSGYPEHGGAGMPEPVPAVPSEYQSEGRRTATQMQDDGFGLSALQAGAVAAGASSSNHEKRSHQQEEPSGMYYDAEEGAAGAGVGGSSRGPHESQEQQQEFGQGNASEAWQHSSSARGQADQYSLYAVDNSADTAIGGPSSQQHENYQGGTHGEVPSYEVATGQAGHGQHSQFDPHDGGGATSPSAMRAAGSYRPLPVPGGASEWPNEKR